ncbi:hypothetical protein GCM10010218_61080 [Streptomyces mashuensis]|uniref:Caspase domain-containing protein n=1 Tax=Streptomyces mashuensis TaxID=33904 RepID=A0A919BAC4_9ACTN|nr:hypothetical protein [Streptomyces mashuensis]GHF71648.1 hypothetical protein GCM10010218_61080 [Streptomyces mashuensis]
MASRAVVIGPWEYADDAGVPRYEEIGISAAQYGKVLADNPMWGEDRCRVLTKEEVDTADGVMAALEEEAGRTGAGDVFLVVYVGHGAYWGDVPGAEVHFSVGSSYDGKPWTWLSSWYLYRAMRLCRADLKVLIADCCYSNMLPHLGNGLDTLPGVFDDAGQGTCVLTALKDDNIRAWPLGCTELPGELAKCTPFSGHLLDVLQRGTTDYRPHITLGLLRDAVVSEMRRCRFDHDKPRMLLNDARESRALFTNRMDAALREPHPGSPVSAKEWVAALLRGNGCDLEELLQDPRKTGEVVALLRTSSREGAAAIAQHLEERASALFRSHDFARYWNKAERALRA